MRAVVILLAGLMAASPAAAGRPSRPELEAGRWKHVRALSPEASRLVAEGVERSPYIRSQLDALEKSNVVVYLTHSMPTGSGTCLKGHLRFVSAAAGVRYLGVWVDVLAAPDERLALLGHELHHALEVASEPSVRSEQEMAALYRRIGRETTDECFETREAVLAGLRVRGDLARPAMARNGVVERERGAAGLDTPRR